MASELVLRGVPHALMVDGWWLDATDESAATPPAGRTALGLAGLGGVAALLFLVALGDFLFFGQAVGLSLALFAAAVLVLALQRLPRGEKLRPAGLLLLSALPVVEHVQALSVGFLAVGLGISLLWAQGGFAGLASRGLALLASLPLRGVMDGYSQTQGMINSDGLRRSTRAAMGWAFPVGGAFVLAGLLLLANPLLGQMLSDLFAVQGKGIVTLGRASLWLGLALILWPLLAPPPPVMVTVLPAFPAQLCPNAQSVARGLLVFNAILAVQTVMDAVYLWGGASLPQGMTAAEYAHRGAYPLLVTALLAGAFALVARPFAREDKWLRRLLLLWLAQNVALVLSALLRLELYVEAFGLTYLRLHSAIWMGLVAAGLGLTAWQVWRDRTNLWLVTRTAGLAVTTLYAACFVNFAAIIATENLSRDRYDAAYVCALGPAAAAAIKASGRQLGAGLGVCRVETPKIDGWRDWGYRDWRVNRYLKSMPVRGVLDEDSGRG